VQAASTVRVAVPVIEAVVDSNIRGQGSVLVMGIDMTGDRSLRDYDLEDSKDDVIDDPLIFLAQADSLIVSKEFADRNQIAVGTRLPLGTAEGTKTFKVRGIVKTSGLASAFGGNIAIMTSTPRRRCSGAAGRSIASISRESPTWRSPTATSSLARCWARVFMCRRRRRAAASSRR
jgi:hypothetical protein